MALWCGMAWDVAGWRVPTVVSSWVMRPGQGVVVPTLSLPRKASGWRATLLQAGSHGCGIMDEGVVASGMEGSGVDG